MSKSLSISIGTALLLAGCGSAPTVTLLNDKLPPFDAANACAIMPKEKVAEIAGTKVESATLGTVVQPGEGTAGFSTCNYGFAGGGTLAFFARQSPIDDNTPEAVARTKQELADAMGAKIVDVPGLGTAAFSAEQMHQLHVFFAGNRYLYFMSPTPPAGKPIAEVELALAKAVIG